MHKKPGRLLLLSLLFFSFLLCLQGCVKEWSVTFKNCSNLDVELLCAQWQMYRKHGTEEGMERACLPKGDTHAAFRFNDAIRQEDRDLVVRWVAVSGNEVVDFGSFYLNDLEAKATIVIRDNRVLARDLHVQAILFESEENKPK